MEKFIFHKYSSSGNDFIIIDNWEGTVPEKDMPKIVKLLCRNKFGIGADGAVFLISGPDDVDFAWRVFKADGSELEISGNGALCAAHMANTLGIAPTEMSFKTKAGVVDAIVEEHKVCVSLPKIGRPEGTALIEVEGISLIYHRMNTGTAQAVALVEELDTLNVAKIGRALRRHPSFAPDGSSINFVKISKDKISIRSYDRGIDDESLASGCGCAAAVLLAASQGLINTNTAVCHTRGGEELGVSFEGSPEEPSKLTLTGRVRYLFSGQVEPDLFLK